MSKKDRLSLPVLIVAGILLLLSMTPLMVAAVRFSPAQSPTQTPSVVVIVAPNNSGATDINFAPANVLLVIGVNNTIILKNRGYCRSHYHVKFRGYISFRYRRHFRGDLIWSDNFHHTRNVPLSLPIPPFYHARHDHSSRRWKLIRHGSSLSLSKYLVSVWTVLLSAKELYERPASNFINYCYDLGIF